MVRQHPSTEAGPERSAGARPGDLAAFRLLALVTATLLVVLVGAGVPLQLVARRPELANVVGTVHGVCYVVYLVAAFRLARGLLLRRWQMALLLLAGTVPLCGFVAERAMTRRFARAVSGAALGGEASLAERAARARARWLSRRAVRLHVMVAVVAPACVVAGWWQATRALSGNGLSWFYSVEWPVFALLALAGWWQLVHEDPAAYRARRASGEPAGGAAAVAGPLRRLTVARSASQLATALSVLVGIELATGVAAVVLVPFSRASGWNPAKGTAVYVLHAVLGGPLAVGAAVLLSRTRGGARLARMAGSVGAAGVALAAAGGLLTGAHGLRLAGMGCMLLGAIVGGFGFLLPGLERLERRSATPS